MTEVRVAEITQADAERSGFETRDALLEYMASASDEPLTPSTKVFRVQLHHAGDGDRVELALLDRLSADDVRDIRQRLARLDAARPWTRATLDIILRRPRVAASQLAAELDRDKLEFKVDVRKLKKLGLTQSFEVGYEISPRGRAYLAASSRPGASETPVAKSKRPRPRARQVEAASRATSPASRRSTSDGGELRGANPSGVSRRGRATRGPRKDRG